MDGAVDESRRSGILCAFDRIKHDLNSAFAGYFERWRDPLWNEPLRIATQMYVEANSPITADTSLVLGQNVLELVAWVRFVEELQTHTARDFDQRKASERLRELIAWLSIRPAVPAALTSLYHEAEQRGWADGPHAITEVRNSLIHPRSRQRLMATPVRARIELHELILWYVELTLLRLIDYRGGYAKPTRQQDNGRCRACTLALSAGRWPARRFCPSRAVAPLGGHLPTWSGSPPAECCRCVGDTTAKRTPDSRLPSVVGRSRLQRPRL